MLLVAAIVGDVARILAEHSSTNPCRRLLRPQISAGSHWPDHILPLCSFARTRTFLLWVAEQFFGAYMQLAGFSNVSAFAHLGGAAVGVIFWFFSRNE